jgi:hypothetical protein
VTSWLESIRLEYLEPDRWEETEAMRRLTGGGDESNTPFTEEERQVVAAGLRLLATRLIEEGGLTGDQVEELDRRFTQRLEDATTKLGRRDWLNLLVGAIMTEIARYALGSETARGLFKVAADSLGALFGIEGVPELPGGPPVEV